jgi:type IV pilus assembly protein PilE
MKTMKHRQAERLVNRVTRRLRFGMNAQRGFTLIELLVVIIIIAVLCTIAIPTFLGQRQHAHDAAAYSMVRNALTAMQGAFVDTGDYTKITTADLRAIEPSIMFVDGGGDLVGTNPAWMSDAIPANAADRQVAFFAQSKTVADLACVSASGNRFGIQVDTVTIGQSGYVKVKVVEGTTQLGW